jgi:hypothetical protein
MTTALLGASVTVFVLSVCVQNAWGQINMVDNPQSPWQGRSSTILTVSEPVTISSGADVFVLDVQTYANHNWTGCKLYLGSTPLIQATGEIPAVGGQQVDTAIYYLENPTAGNFTLSGTFGSAVAAQANYYTLSGVDTSQPIVAQSANGGSSLNASLTLATNDGDFAAVDQAAYYGAIGTYAATSGNPNELTEGQIYNLFGSDGYIEDLTGSGGSDTITATLGLNSGTNHPVSAVVFAPLPTPEPSTLALLGAGALGLAGYAWRQRRKRSLSLAGEPTLANYGETGLQEDMPAILSFPSRRRESTRRAA